ncbi:hypothetical protein FQA47_020056 [Oryzias melastigma]|uniref:Uncharacterized protein n=1 Tax=Oryzias melastigma TaxID=30732 RepID=A0A834FGW5_ORYME|nr:hypothetical protein FQA47_020056 [Oryzias melastigma]
MAPANTTQYLMSKEYEDMQLDFVPPVLHHSSALKYSDSLSPRSLEALPDSISRTRPLGTLPIHWALCRRVASLSGTSGTQLELWVPSGCYGLQVAPLRLGEELPRGCLTQGDVAFSP